MSSRNRSAASFLLAVAALAASPEAGAQAAVQNVVLRNSFNPAGAGARGLGMGGAFLAVADDGTAAAFNPAGLAQLRRTELVAVGFTDSLASDLNVPASGGGVETRSTKQKHKALDFAGLAIPFDVGGKNLTVQLSYQRAVDMFGRGSAVTQDTVPAGDLFDRETLAVVGLEPFRPIDVVAEIAPSQDGAFHTATAAVGYEATSRLSLGAAENYWVADWSSEGTSNFRLLIAPRPGVRPVEFFRFEERFVQEQAVRGLNLNLGFLLRYPRLSVGGVMRLPFGGQYVLDETGTTQEYFAGEVEPATPRAVVARSGLRWPRSAGLGVALRPFRGLTLAGDVLRSQWSRTTLEDVPGGALLTPREFDPVTGDEREVYRDLNFFDLLAASQTTTADTTTWRAGAEYLVSLPKVVVPLRAGIFRDRSPVAELGSDEGRRIEGFTVGTGLNFSRLVLDVAFERRESDGVVGLRFRRGEPVEQGNPTESVREDRVVVSVVFRFGADDPLKRALRYLVVGKEEKQDN
jgi:hypothetical protein